MSPPAHPQGLERLDALSLRGLFVRGEASAREITRAHLDRIEQVEPTVSAFLSVDPTEALRQAEALDEARARGVEAGPLAAVPVAVKDVVCVKGAPATCGSRVLEGFVPPYDATAVDRLRRSGAVILGKTNMDEFAMGSSTEHSAYGVSRNPWDPERVPGGSSGGSAVAVAAREAALALGSDTGGSIRQPGAFTGTVGMKPTYGRVSRFGLVAFASSLDQMGPISRTVRDAAAMLSAIAGRDPRDMTSTDVPPADYVGAAAHAARSMEGLRVGVPDEYFGEGLDPEIDAAVRNCHSLAAGMGANLVSASLPMTQFAIAAYYIVATAEASSNLARYDGVRFGRRDKEASSLRDMYEATRTRGFGDEVKRRIMLGTYALSAGYYDAYYLKAMKARTLIRKDFDEAFSRCDVLMVPTTPSPAFRIGEKLDDPLAMYLSDIYTVTANLAGLPALSLPCGFTRQGMPIGCQIIARPFDESTIFATAAALEEALDLSSTAPAQSVDR